MAKLKLTFSVLGQEQFNRSLAGINNEVKDLTPEFNLLANDFRETEEKQFAGSGGAEGNPQWAVLSEPYATMKKMQYGELPILTRTRDLRNSLTIKGAKGHVEEITPMNLKIGTKIPYASVHQTGATIGPHDIFPKSGSALRFYDRSGNPIFAKKVHHPGCTIPIRPPIRFSDKQKKRWVKILRTQLKDRIATKAIQQYRPVKKS